MENVSHSPPSISTPLHAPPKCFKDCRCNYSFELLTRSVQFQTIMYNMSSIFFNVTSVLHNCWYSQETIVWNHFIDVHFLRSRSANACWKFTLTFNISYCDWAQMHGPLRAEVTAELITSQLWNRYEDSHVKLWCPFFFVEYWLFLSPKSSLSK